MENVGVGGMSASYSEQANNSSIDGKEISIHSGYFNSAYSSPLLLRGVPDYSIDIVSELKRPSATVKDLPSGRKAPNLPLSHHAPQSSSMYEILLCNRIQFDY